MLVATFILNGGQTICLLILPSKQIVEKIVHDVKSKTNINQWKNTNDVINWFNNIDHKNSHTLICFDICDFYPSISHELLQNALKFASKYSVITDEQVHIINHTKKTTLYKDGEPWCKKTSTFDVTMGSFDGAEICELVGLFLLSQLQYLNINVGLYRDDGLAVTNQTPRNADKIKKEICKIFKENGLSITADANKKVVDFFGRHPQFEYGAISTIPQTEQQNQLYPP